MNHKKIFYCESFFLVFYILSILVGLFVPVLISKAVEKTNIKCITALGLPGKVAPITSAEFIKEKIYNILK